MFTIKSTEQLLRERGIEKGGKVQKFIDSEVIRCMDPFTPFRNGYLKKSATLGTVIGVDDIGSIMVRWDNGCGLSVAYGEDRCRRVSHE